MDSQKLDLAEVHATTFDELSSQLRWVNWRLLERSGKKTKIPFQPNGSPAESDNPKTWSTHQHCIDAVSKFDGIGCMIAEPYTGTDFDHVRVAGTTEPLALSNGTILPHFEELIMRLGSYAEESPSGDGVHVWNRGPVPSNRGRSGKHPHTEMYCKERYFTWTGKHIAGTPLRINPSEFLKILHRDIEKLDPRSVSVSEITNTRITTAEKMLRFQNGEWQGLLGSDGKPYDSQSEADCGYCAMLAKVLNGDPAKMDEAFRKSKMMREKWDVRHGEQTYGAMTIARALVNFKAKTSSVAELDDVDAEDVEDEKIEWLWPGKIALGKLNILTGYPDMLKSTILDDIVVRLRKQLPWGDGTPNTMPPSGSILLCTEEDYADTRKPRLRAAGLKDGDFRDYIRFVRGVKVKEEDAEWVRNVALLEDCEKLARRLEQYPHIKLVGFDPQSDYLGPKIDENSNKDVRHALKPLTDLLRDFKVAGVGIVRAPEQY